jgi:hypothetical protein
MTEVETAMCQDCLTAAVKSHHGFKSGCSGCAARAAGRSPEFARARAAGKQDRGYQTLLTTLGLTHESVKAAHAADAMNRSKA